ASTVADNTGAYFAAQIHNLVYDGFTTRTAQTTLRDTIVAGGIGPVDVASSKTAYIIPAPNKGSADLDMSQFDLVRTAAAQEAGTITGAPLTADPLLGPLAANGGPTATMLPGAGSSVIDAGSAFALTTDQRGRARLFDFASTPNAGDGSDIGAVEVQPAASGGGGGGGGGGAGGALATISALRVSPSSFAAASRGASIAARRKTGTKISYVDSLAATTTFTVLSPQRGVKAKNGRCVKPSKRRRGRRCTRYVSLGSFAHVDHLGANSFH